MKSNDILYIPDNIGLKGSGQRCGSGNHHRYWRGHLPVRTSRAATVYGQVEVKG